VKRGAGHPPKFAPSVTRYQQLATALTPQFCKLNRFRSPYGLLSAVFLYSDSAKKTPFEAKNLLFPQGAPLLSQLLKACFKSIRSIIYINN
jgi:hypothetical protein